MSHINAVWAEFDDFRRSAVSCLADEYNSFVKAWDNGNVDGWNAPTTAFTFNMTASPGCAQSNTMITAGLNKSPEDLGSEAGASGFDPYTIVKYQGDSDPVVTTCSFSFTILSAGKPVSTTTSLPISKSSSETFDGLGCIRSNSGSYSKQQSAIRCVSNSR